ncbi:hypothetical protein ACWCQ0_33620 [Streptomyces massasporeus]
MVLCPRERTVTISSSEAVLTLPPPAEAVSDRSHDHDRHGAAPVLTVWVVDAGVVRGEAERAGVPLLPSPSDASGRFRAVGPYGTTVEFREMSHETLVSRLLAKTDTVSLTAERWFWITFSARATEGHRNRDHERP